MGVDKVILFIEGETNSPNGNLRQGFSKLLEGSLGGKKPALKMGDGKCQAVKKFLKNKLPCSLALLLVDLDGPENILKDDLVQNGLEAESQNVFYMIQEMESWFISQPNILDLFYGVDENKKKISEKLLKKNPRDFPEPDKELEKLTKTTSRGEYHKIKHGVELLKLLDSRRLELDFSEYKRLIDRLR